ncbi:MAG: DUF2752 domain-containing protein [Deltaproteobacteria bacterium]|nr:DUF2752 domain-containing protein [Deltaproteobacteria bacterium]
MALKQSGKDWGAALVFFGAPLVLLAGLFLDIGDLPGRTICTIKRLYLLDCPGCGLTRAFLLIPQGDFLKALQLNAASLSLYLIGVLVWLKAGFSLFKKASLLPPWFSFLIKILGFLTLVLMIGHCLWKAIVFFENQGFSVFWDQFVKNGPFWLSLL